MKAHRVYLFLFFSTLVGRAELVAHWTFDEAAGTTAGDSSANNRNGTIAGGAIWNTTDLPAIPSGSSAALQFDGVDDQVDIIGYKGISGTGDRTISCLLYTSPSPRD